MAKKEIADHQVTHSEYRPRASNDTEEGRRRNRRIEILLGPVPSPERGAR